LAQARTLVRALRVEMMPAFATLTVCCSITSCSCGAHITGPKEVSLQYE
jgi:hypothetical protein